jgi:hypothetical protein
VRYSERAWNASGADPTRDFSHRLLPNALKPDAAVAIFTPRFSTTIDGGKIPIERLTTIVLSLRPFADSHSFANER